jgi:threonine aldolase
MQRFDNNTPRRRIDLRTDAITEPTPAMWRAMEEAKLGWASAGEDDNVAGLEDEGARLAGKDAGLFVLTGNMANLAALMSHAGRGDQILLESTSHVLWCEEWSMTYIAGLFVRPLAGRRGRVEAEAVIQAISESQYRHRPKTALLCLENSDNVFGAALGPEHIEPPARAARELGASVHLDGARVLNACVARDVTLAAMLEHVDSAMISLNKGLSAPGGALLVGPREFIAASRLNLRRLGGASHHQAGIYAAAGLVALTTMMGQLADDNRRAHQLATLLEPLSGLHVDPSEVETNVLVVELAPEFGTSESFLAELAGSGVAGYVSGPQSMRFVTHRHIDDAAVAHAADAVRALVQRKKA